MYCVGLSGTHNTGKTTALHGVVHNLKKAGLKVKFMDEGLDNVIFPINEEATFESQLYILVNHVRRELELRRKFAKYDVLLFDRTIFDVVPYTEHMVELGAISDTAGESIRNIVRNLMFRIEYDLLLLFQPGVPMTDDGVRSTNVDFQLAIHKRFLELPSELLSDTPYDFSLVDSPPDVVAMATLIKEGIKSHKQGESVFVAE